MSLIVTSSNSKGFDEKDTKYDASGNIIFNVQDYPLGTEDPASYQNFFNAPLTIKKNSEVAVQSVKFNRPNRAEIDPGHYRYYIYMGKAVELINQPIENSVNMPVLADLDPGTYTEQGLAATIQNSINRYMYHPSCAGQGIVTTIGNTTTSVFDGFSIVFQGLNSNDNSNTKASLPNSIHPVSDGTFFEKSTSISFDRGTGIISKLDDLEEAVGQLGCAGVGETSQCLSPDGGEFVIKIPTDTAGATGRWEIGLSRPIQSNVSAPVYFNDQGDFDEYFCDFNVVKGTDNRIYVRQNLKDGANNGIIVSDVEYWSAANSNGYSWDDDDRPLHFGCLTQIDMTDNSVYSGLQGTSAENILEDCTYEIVSTGDTDFLADFGAADNNPNTIFRATADGDGDSGTGVVNQLVETSDLTHLRFTLKNDYLTIEMGPVDFAQGKTVILCDTGYGKTSWTPAATPIAPDPAHANSYWVLPDRTNKNHYLRPVNQCMWNLQPQIRLYSTGGAGSAELIEFQGRDLPTETDRDFFTGSWWGSLPAQGLMEQARELDVGRLQQSDTTYVGNTKIPTDYIFLGMPTVSADQYPDAMSTFDMGLIVSTGENGVVKYPNTPDANTSRLFGFPNYTYVDQSILNSPNYSAVPNTNTEDPKYSYKSFQSTNTPVLTTGQSCFVRCPTLTHQSQNGASSGMSKILYHLPRFSDTGNDVGPLFWNPPEMVYLDLNNPADITLNNIQIDIVDKDEKIVSDLNNNTIVVLHVREKK
tara:strand:- start:1067 stop:3334 length:2268 start_codon:yes stop_codon:yes gene_type:complete